jgi:hypothetical protein
VPKLSADIFFGAMVDGAVACEILRDRRIHARLSSVMM